MKKPTQIRIFLTFALTLLTINVKATEVDIVPQKLLEDGTLVFGSSHFSVAACDSAIEEYGLMKWQDEPHALRTWAIEYLQSRLPNMKVVSSMPIIEHHKKRLYVGAVPIEKKYKKFYRLEVKRDSSIYPSGKATYWITMVLERDAVIDGVRGTFRAWEYRPKPDERIFYDCTSYLEAKNALKAEIKRALDAFIIEVYKATRRR